MKTISVFNNKGGVGKTTLTFHVAHALSEMGHKVLIIDADPQCNLTIYSLDQEYIHSIWETEDPFIDAMGAKFGWIYEIADFCGGISSNSFGRWGILNTSAIRFGYFCVTFCASAKALRT
jgi:hypothetical protein